MPVAYIQPKNWTDFQHYKDRSPSWIKLHKSILDNYEYQCLPIASKALAPMLWLLASEYEDGKIPADLNRIAFRVRLSVSDLDEAIKPLISSGFFVGYQGASEVLAPCLPREEKRREEIEKEKEVPPASQTATAPSAKKGTRLSADWKPSDELLAWAKAERPDLNLSSTVETFIDYWVAKPGKDGTKLDWNRTFKVWVRGEKSRPVDPKQNVVRPISTRPAPETPEQKAERKRREQAAFELHMRNLGVEA